MNKDRIFTYLKVGCLIAVPYSVNACAPPLDNCPTFPVENSEGDPYQIVTLEDIAFARECLQAERVILEAVTVSFDHQSTFPIIRPRSTPALPSFPTFDTPQIETQEVTRHTYRVGNNFKTMITFSLDNKPRIEDGLYTIKGSYQTPVVQGNNGSLFVHELIPIEID